MKKFKAPLALFLLVLFVFPLVKKELHSRDHSNDVHCKAITTHLHQLEHNCSFCDFKGPATEVPLYIQSDFILSTIDFQFIPPFQKCITFYSGSALRGRAPPVC